MKDNRKNNPIRTGILTFCAMFLFALLTMGSIPARAAVHIEEIEYDGKGKFEIDFTSDVKYKKFKLTVKDSKKKAQKVRIIEKDEDELDFRIVNNKPGETYSYKITGIRKKGDKKNTTLTGKVRIPKSIGSVKVKEIEYDSDDGEVEFEFKQDVKWKSVKVTITKGGKNYVRYIEDKDDDGIEVKVKKLQKGAVYNYTIKGIKKKNGGSFSTISGSFRA